MELLAVSEVSILKSDSSMQYIIDREELLRLHESGLIPNKLYDKAILFILKTLHRHPLILWAVGLRGGRILQSDRPTSEKGRIATNGTSVNPSVVLK